MRIFCRRCFHQSAFRVVQFAFPMWGPFAPRSLPVSSLLRSRPIPAWAFTPAGLPSSWQNCLHALFHSAPPCPTPLSRTIVSGRISASCSLKHWPHGICVTRLYPWIHFRYGSRICARGASPRRSPFTVPATLLMQWSIHKANTFQFASSAKLCLAHQRTQRR